MARIHKKTASRVVLITGATSGIGKVCAEHLHRIGYRVYGTSRHAEDSNGEIKVQADGQPSTFSLLKMNLLSDESVQQALDRIMKLEGRIDVVLNNAGYGLAGAVEDTPIPDAQVQLDTNFMGAVRVCRLVIPLMRQQGAGYIVNMSSMAGVLGVPFQGFYSAGKFAIEGLSQSLRFEVRPYGIRIVVIRPGDFNTGFTGNRKKVEPGQGSLYEQQFNTALGIMERDEIRGPSPDQIAHLLERIITTRSPRFCYTAGSASQRFLIGIRRVVPFSLFERLVRIYYRLR